MLFRDLRVQLEDDSERTKVAVHCPDPDEYIAEVGNTPVYDWFDENDIGNVNVTSTQVLPLVTVLLGWAHWNYFPMHKRCI